MFSLKFCIIVYLNFVLLSVLVNCTLSPSDRDKKSKATVLKVKRGPHKSDVFQRNLIEEEPAAKDILIENGAYYEDTTRRLFNSTTLGYITPWNNHGYYVATNWAQKFDIISPVWLQIVRDKPNNYKILGLHDIDNNWLNDVRINAGNKNKIMPRVIFEKFTDTDYMNLLTYAEQRLDVIKLVIKTCKKYNFNGIVLEIWSQLSVRVDDEHLITLVREIADALHNNQMEIILTVPPFRKEMYDLFSSKHFEILYPMVDAFSLMTYDFSSNQRPGAAAPLYWVRKAVNHIVPKTTSNYMEKRSKILLGLNLYGNDFTPDGGTTIVGHEFLELIKSVKGRFQHDDHDVENFIEIKTSTGRHTIFYPTLYSIHERIKLARELGTGLSLWELGQGLDYFYDLL